jgi:hypothetical protein
LSYREVVGLYNLLVHIQLQRIEQLGLSEEFKNFIQAIQEINQMSSNKTLNATPTAAPVGEDTPRTK